MRRAALPWLIGMFIAFGAEGVEAGPLRLTLDDVAARVTAANLEFQATSKEVDLASANLERSKALLPSNPFLSAGSQHSQKFRPDLGVWLSQEFEIAGQRQKRIDAATQNVDKANWELKNDEQRLVASAKTAFIHALVSADRVTLAQHGVDAANELAGELEERRLASPTRRLDLNVAQIQETRARRDLASAQLAYDNGLDALRELLSLPFDEEIELAGAPETEVKDLPSSAELTQRALQQRPDLVALHHAVQLADLQLVVVQRERIPNVTLSASLSRFEGDTLAGGSVGVPIPLFHDKTAEIQEATAERARASLQLENLEKQVEKEVREAARTCTVTGEDLRAQQRDIVPKSEENVRLQKQLQDRGQVTTSELVGAQVDLLTAQRDYLDAVESYNNALIELERVMGGTVAASDEPPKPATGETSDSPN